ncbi:ATP-binding protein [Streptomyces sp. NPDC002547]
MPLLVALVLAVPLSEQRVKVVRQADQTASLMRLAGPLGALVEQIQREQLLAVAHLAAPTSSDGTLVVGMGTVDTTLADVRSQTDGMPKVREALRVPDLRDLRAEVLTASATPLDVSRRYDAVVVELLDSLELWHLRAGSGADIQRQSSLEALLRSDIAGNSAEAALMAGLGQRQGPEALETATEQQALQSLWAQRFQRTAEPEYARLARVNTTGSVATRALEFSTLVRREVDTPSLSSAARAHLLEEAANTFLIQAELRLLAQHTIARDAEQEATAKAHHETVDTIVLGIALATVLVALLLISIVVGRSVSIPLRMLTQAAARAAGAAERELQRISDDATAEPLNVGPLRFAMRRSDEIGHLSEAVERVQTGALDLVRRQQASQRNVAAMFASVGRRTHNLVSRQLSMIDDLERNETDRTLLESLYRLDHLTNRLRRTAANLVVLSGTTERFGFGKPVSLVHTMRSALAEVEGFQRVVLTSVADLHLAPEAGQPLISIMAELVENALSFSPPNTAVEMSAAYTTEGCLIAVKDSGVGMNEQRLAEENARIRSRERLDLVPTETLGLFVVGRLARQMGMGVTLSAGEEGGVTAWITVPRQHFVRTHVTRQADAAPIEGRFETSLPVLAQEAVGRPSEGRRRSHREIQARTQLDNFRRTSVEHTAVTSQEVVDSTAAEPALQSALPLQGGLIPGNPADTFPATGPFQTFVNDLRETLSQMSKLTPWPAFEAVDREAPDSPLWTQRPIPRPGTDQAEAPPLGAEGLIRRVPGANLASDVQRPAAMSAQTRHDPDAARSLVDDFEAGVARARGESAHPPSLP